MQKDMGLGCTSYLPSLGLHWVPIGIPPALFGIRKSAQPPGAAGRPPPTGVPQDPTVCSRGFTGFRGIPATFPLDFTGFHGSSPGSTGLPQDSTVFSREFTGLHRVFPPPSPAPPGAQGALPTEPRTALPSHLTGLHGDFTGLHGTFTGFHGIPLEFTGFHRGSTGFHRGFSRGFTGSHTGFSPDSTGSHRVSREAPALPGRWEY